MSGWQPISTAPEDGKIVRGTTAWWIAREHTNAFRLATLRHQDVSLHTWDDLTVEAQRARVDAAQALLDSGVVLLAGPPTSYRKAWLRRLRFRLRWSRAEKLARGFRRPLGGGS